MRKFECTQCCQKCQIMFYLEPKFCLLFGDKADWHEVKEDSAENEQFGNSEQLPDWVKVGELIYCGLTNHYAEITEIKGEVITIHVLDSIMSYSLDIYKFLQSGYPARKRPFNEDEMKELVGKVLGWENNLELVISYNEADIDIYVDQMWCSAKYLMDNEYTINGKPCYKLEHLNDKGEWVK